MLQATTTSYGLDPWKFAGETQSNSRWARSASRRHPSSKTRRYVAKARSLGANGIARRKSKALRLQIGSRAFVPYMRSRKV